MFSLLTGELFSANSDVTDDVLGLLVAIVMLSCATAIRVTMIVACCYLGRRLGYDLYAGLFLLIPGLNVIVFFYWAFKELPNEKKLRRYLAKNA